MQTGQEYDFSRDNFLKDLKVESSLKIYKIIIIMGVFPEYLKSVCSINGCIIIFIITVFRVAKVREQLKWPLDEGQTRGLLPAFLAINYFPEELESLNLVCSLTK